METKTPRPDDMNTDSVETGRVGHNKPNEKIQASIHQLKFSRFVMWIASEFFKLIYG